MVRVDEGRSGGKFLPCAGHWPGLGRMLSDGRLGRNTRTNIFGKLCISDNGMRRRRHHRLLEDPNQLTRKTYAKTNIFLALFD